MSVDPQTLLNMKIPKRQGRKTIYGAQPQGRYGNCIGKRGPLSRITTSCWGVHEDFKEELALKMQIEDRQDSFGQRCEGRKKSIPGGTNRESTA